MSLWSVLGATAGGVGGFMLGGPVGAVAGASLGGSLGGSIDQANAVGDASAAQRDATNASIDEQRRQYDTTRSDYAPFRAAGAQALSQLQTDIGGAPTAAEVMSDPGYQFGMQQGQQGLDRKAAAAGGRVSGAALKSAAEYASNYATTGYNAAYQRRQDRLNRLAAIAGLGQTATSGSAAAGAGASNAISGALSSQGDASGAARMAKGNIWAGAVNQLGAVGQRWASQPSTINGFNGNSQTGYTYLNPETVGPMPG